MPRSAAESLYAPQRLQCLMVVENFPGHMTGVAVVSPQESIRPMRYNTLQQGEHTYQRSYFS